MNPKTSAFDPSRRKFIGACCASVTATGMLSALAQLRMIGAVASPENGGVVPPTTDAAPQSDFKALVCIFLAGGNDANNLIIPTDTTTYAAYRTGRGALALESTAALGITPRTNDGRTWGLHPSLGINPNGTTNGGLKGLFDQGKVAVLANVGSLSYPMTQAQYMNGSVPRPLQLFSHNNQQVEWMSSIPDKEFSQVGTGWGGRLADLTNAFNSNNRVSMSISVNGQNSFQVGKNVAQYAVGTNGAIGLTGTGTGTSVNGLRTAAMNELLAQQNGNLFEAAYGGLTAGALSNSALLSSVVTGTSPFASFFTGLNSSLSQQLHMIARLVNAQSALGLKRQVFFARTGGFDLHDNQVTAGNTATGAHANLFRDLSQATTAFYNALASVGAENQVTAFTASDFGRTFNTNGDGSDHGWGSHHLVLGGAVRGGDIYGKMPTFAINGPDDTGRGRWIPTTSVDEYSATLAKWFGVSPTDLPVVLPNIGRFAKPDLGFMG